MIVKAVKNEWYQDYKKPSMYIAFPYCSFKCEKEGKVRCCQNSALSKSPDIDVSVSELIEKYTSNPITQAVVCGGLEPLDSWDDLKSFIANFRYWCNDDIVIYTGYKEEEIQDKIEWLRLYEPIIVKFNRFIPNQPKHYDELLGVYLASLNQYAKQIL